MIDPLAYSVGLCLLLAAWILISILQLVGLPFFLAFVVVVLKLERMADQIRIDRITKGRGFQ